ncbi:MAG: tRNA dihydrouridine synthase DusB [Lachnospiraceae bacterium]|nr:tRNA dihydrouridine synthase DusB [Lachnospiraceae bacterium]
MAGVTDQPFRRICHGLGAALVSMEMVSANAVRHGNKKTRELIHIAEDEHPVSMQLFGPDADTMRYALENLEDVPYDILDINMGCPVPKIVKNGEGSALMLDLDRAEEIVRVLARESDRPVTVKIRRGFDDKHINAVEAAKRFEAAGAAMIAVHGRTREQYYSGKADWDIIRQVKEAVKIPVAGNGDVKTPEDARRMMNETGCNLVMIARGARGNPWIFRDTLSYLESGIIQPRPSVEEVRAMMQRHMELQLIDKGDYLGICQMRKHIAWYTTGLPHSAALRERINKANTKEEMETVLDAWVEACAE